MERTKKGRNPFAPKKSLHAKKKEINKGFDKSKLLCFCCQKSGHFIQDCHVKKRKEGRFYASATVEENSKEDAPKEKETRREYYLVSVLSGSLITREDTWLIDNGASNHMSGYKGTISNLKEKQFVCMVEFRDNSTYSIQGVGSTSF